MELYATNTKCIELHATGTKQMELHATDTRYHALTTSWNGSFRT